METKSLKNDLCLERAMIISIMGLCLPQNVFFSCHLRSFQLVKFVYFEKGGLFSLVNRLVVRRKENQSQLMLFLLFI